MWQRQQYRYNPDKKTRELERALSQGDESARRPLISQYERTHDWDKIFDLLPKENILLKEPLYCGCSTDGRRADAPLMEIENFEVPQGYGVLGRCDEHGELHAILLNVSAIIEAYGMGIPHLYSFDFAKGFEVGYYILGQQYSCTGVTIGPDHASHLRILPNGWLSLRLWFPPNMVHTMDAFIAPINDNGVGQVEAEIDPDEIDWWVRTRGVVRSAPEQKFHRNPYPYPYRC